VTEFLLVQQIECLNERQLSQGCRVAEVVESVGQLAVPLGFMKGIAAF
jgi:hypothetical protein